MKNRNKNKYKNVTRRYRKQLTKDRIQKTEGETKRTQKEKTGH